MKSRQTIAKKMYEHRTNHSAGKGNRRRSVADIPVPMQEINQNGENLSIHISCKNLKRINIFLPLLNALYFVCLLLVNEDLGAIVINDTQPIRIVTNQVRGTVAMQRTVHPCNSDAKLCARVYHTRLVLAGKYY